MYEQADTTLIKNEKFLFPKTVNKSSTLRADLKWTREIENLGRKIGIMSIDEIQNETNKLNLLKRIVDHNAMKPINLNAKPRVNKFESQSLFMMKPTKRNEQNENLESNSLILPKIKAIKLEYPESIKKKPTDKFGISDLKIKSAESGNDINFRSKSLFKHLSKNPQNTLH